MAAAMIVELSDTTTTAINKKLDALREEAGVITMGQEAVLFEVAQLEPDGGGCQGERVGNGGGVERPLALHQVQDGAAGRRQLLQGRFGLGAHGRIRCTSPNSCHRYPSSRAAA